MQIALKCSQINTFSLQLLHEDVQVSAGGLFTIDMTLLFSVNIKTYHVVQNKNILIFTDGGSCMYLYCYINSV